MISNKLFRLIAIGTMICLLVTFATVHLTNSLIGRDITVSPVGYDNYVTDDSLPTGGFVRTATQNKSILDTIRQFEYGFFGIVDQDNVIVGKNDFLFMLEDADNGYHFLKDHRGEFKFSNSQKQKFISELLRREAYFAERGAEYMLVVLPNTATLYRENLPDYIGKRKSTTRLEDLDIFINQRGLTHAFLNTTDYLIDKKGEELLANNTENSLNALGLYYAYLALCEKIGSPAFNKDHVIQKDGLTFYTYQTAGKQIAELAGLEGVVKNNSVSLAEGSLSNYETVYAEGFFKKTERISESTGGTPFSVLVQFSQLSDRLLCEPYFSATFDFVTLQSNHYENESFLEVASPQLVVQFIYENELSTFASLR